MHYELRNRTPRRAEQGFTLIEVITSLFVLTILLVACLALFDFSAKIARAQTHVAELQQSLRIGQYQMLRQVRMAGRGGLLRGPFPQSTAVHVRNNVGDPEYIAIGNAASPKIVPGTDVLTVRGVFSTPIYHINPPGAALVLDLDADENPVAGSVQIRDPIPETGVSQDLQPLIDAVDRRDALVIVSPLGGGLYAVVELDPDHARTDTSDDSNVVLGFQITGGVRSAEFLAISPGGIFPQELRSVGYVGLLEEHRYYVREQFEIDGDPTSLPKHRLAQAEFYPGTQAAYAGDANNLAIDIADNFIDLQVALGVDTDFDLTVEEDSPPTTTDEWLYNHVDDDPTTDLTKWNGGTQTPKLFFARITSLAQTDRRDFRHVDLPIDRVEDRVYGEGATPADATEAIARNHRRRLLQSVVDMRNL